MPQSIHRYIVGLVMILTGGCIYILMRPHDLFGGLPVLFTTALYQKNFIPDWILYSLPDALWYASLLCFQQPLRFRDGKVAPVLTLIACLTGPVHEILQYFMLAPGTFCLIDLSAYCIVLLIYIIICLRKSVRYAANT